MNTAPGRSRAIHARRVARFVTVLLLAAISISSAAHLRAAQSAQESFPAAWRSVLDGFAQRIAADFPNWIQSAKWAPNSRSILIIALCIFVIWGLATVRLD